MKLSKHQLEKVSKGLSLNRMLVIKQEALREKYPVEVKIVGGFYIIESKLNKDET